jgi:hypothetical protein
MAWPVSPLDAMKGKLSRETSLKSVLVVNWKLTFRVLPMSIQRPTGKISPKTKNAVLMAGHLFGRLFF